ncbi:hypothetical protein ACHAPS_002854 [Verticillium nonalfalfae]
MSGVIAFTLSKLDDSGYYFAFFQDEAGEEYLRIVLGFGILATRDNPSSLPGVGLNIPGFFI